MAKIGAGFSIQSLDQNGGMKVAEEIGQRGEEGLIATGAVRSNETYKGKENHGSAQPSELPSLLGPPPILLSGPLRIIQPGPKSIKSSPLLVGC